MPKRTQNIYRRFHVRFGHKIRELTDDLALIDALRVLLPSYRGPAVTLYRADFLTRNRRRRPFGLSWTANPELAEHIVGGKRFGYPSGFRTMIKTFAPPEAIISRIPRGMHRYGEAEYVVDRRRLHRVEMIPLLRDDWWSIRLEGENDGPDE